MCFEIMISMFQFIKNSDPLFSVAFHKKVILNQTRGQNILSLEVKLEPGSEIVVGIKKRTHGYINLRYIEDHHEFVSCSHSNVKFGIGHIHGWRTLTRDLQTDLVKGLAACKDLEGGLVKFEGIHRLSVLGSGLFFELTSLLHDLFGIEWAWHMFTLFYMLVPYSKLFRIRVPWKNQYRL